MTPPSRSSGSRSRPSRSSSSRQARQAGASAAPSPTSDPTSPHPTSPHLPPPERLASEAFQGQLRDLAGRGLFSLLAVDEAHCISSWGPDFRPHYRRLGAVREACPSVPCLALTATATPKVKADILQQLKVGRSVCRSICLSICLFVCLSVCLSLLSVCPG
jgi:hypothetical protein